MENNALKLDLIILGWRKQLDFGNKKIQVIEPSKKKEKKQRKTIPAKKVFAIIKSFKVTQFYLNLSFKNMAINGILYPFFALLRLKTKRNIQINFFNKNEIIIEVENTFYRIFKAYINS